MEEERIPEGLPTRGTGMPTDRGGNVIPMNRAARRREERDAEIKKRQEEAVRQSQAQYLKGKVTREEVATDLGRLFMGIQALDQRGSDLGVRLEALIQALKKMFPVQPYYDNVTFDEVYGDSLKRMLQWREKIRALDSGDFSLSETLTQMKEWNADPENPPIRGQHFSPGRLEVKIINDLDMSKEEKIQTMKTLGFPQPIIDEVLAKIEEAFSEGLKTTNEAPIGVTLYGADDQPVTVA